MVEISSPKVLCYNKSVGINQKVLRNGALTLYLLLVLTPKMLGRLFFSILYIPYIHFQNYYYYYAYFF